MVPELLTCKISACRTTTQRPKQHRDRVMVSKQYENKIDRIEERLASIEDLLRQYLPAVTPRAEPTLERAAAAPEIVAVDGYTGPHADSLRAREAFEQVAGHNAAIASDHALDAALVSLRGVMDKLKADGVGPTGDSGASAQTPLPSWEDAHATLLRAKRLCLLFLRICVDHVQFLR